MKYSIPLAFLSVIVLSACSRTNETQPIVPPTTTTVATGQVSPDTTTKAYTAADVATHKSSNSCRSIINGKVYDFTSRVEKHPGGPEAILKICGIDGTEILHKQHGMSKDNMLTPYYIGDLAK